MMTTAILSLISLAAIWILVSFLWKDLAIDTMRDELFSLRRDLFIMGLENKDFSFDSEIYRAFEKNINNSIRFGHRIHFLGTIVFALKSAKYSKKLKSEFIQAYNKFMKKSKNTKLKDDLTKVKIKYDYIIAIYMVKTSPLCQTMLFLFFTFIILSQIYKVTNKINIISSSMSQIEKCFSKQYLPRFEYQTEMLANS